ncbi:MAG: hypothetical protein ACK5M3_18500 [Dysgonomonas sp.]
MKQIKFITVMLLLATLILSFNACSDDDDDKNDNLIIGKWREFDTSLSDILEFKTNGTFEYTSSTDPDYEEHGKWKIESGDKLYMLFSDEDDWGIYKIHEVNSISLIVEEYDEKGNLDGEKMIFQRMN